MTFTVDKTTVTEGDVVQVQWDCAGADRVELKIDNGYRCSVMQLDISGTKRFRLNRSKGRTSLTITAWMGERHGSKTIKVRVKELGTTHAETIDDRGKTVSDAKLRWNELQQQFNNMPPDKRVATTALIIVCASFLLSLLYRPLLGIGIMGLLGYLLYVVFRRQ